MARSLNKVQLIGNLTRDPELRYTPSGAGVCTFGVATNRQWTTESGEKKEDAEFHKVVAWNKLAEICSQLLTKGRKVYVEGRLQTRSWDAQDGTKKSTTEIVISDMVVLDSRQGGAPQAASAGEDFDIEQMAQEPASEVSEAEEKPKKVDTKSSSVKPKEEKVESKEEEEEIPF